MIRSRVLVCLAAVISLFFGAIWPNTAVAAVAAVAPAVVSLGSIEAGLSIPGKLDVDAAGNLYVADVRNHLVLKFDSSGDLLRTFDAAQVSGRGLAVTPDGSKLYLTGGGRVSMLNGVTGEFVQFFGDLAAFSGNPGEIDLDANGNLYIMDYARVMVRVFSPEGLFLRNISGFGTSSGQFKSIDAMSVSLATNEVYVSGMQSSTYMSGSSIVQMFSTSGAYSGHLVSSADFGGDIVGTSGISFDNVGREYYLDKVDGSVRVRSQSSGFLSVLKLNGYGPGKVKMPSDLIFEPVTSRLFVSSDDGKIEVFGIDGGTTPEKNQAPGLPTLISPVANGEVAAIRPQLIFANAVDLNGDSLTYDIHVSGVTSVNYEVAEGLNGETVVQVDQDLAENSSYTWQVLAKDGELDSGWTSTQTFHVNAVEEEPSAPVLISALAGESLGGVDSLTWQASVDNDPLDSISYRVEIAADATFDSITVTEQVAASEITLGALSDYDVLQPGTVYFWRVTAIDNDGHEVVSAETGSFRYEATLLAVSSNMPGARVYLSGNAAYTGHYIGIAPIAIHDIKAGFYTVIVERAGCETFIAQVEITGFGSAHVNADLRLAIVPELRRPSALRSVKSQLASAEYVAPFIVDFDNDGSADILVGDSAGSVNLYRALAKRGAKVQYGAPESLDFGQLPGTAIFVVDWNNDNKKDVLVGAADGTVSIYLQKADSSDASPVFDSAVYFRDGLNTVIGIGSQANPAVVDFDGDADKDLVIGTGDGRILLYLNEGTDAQHAFASEPINLITFAGSGSVAPLFIDWDADGSRDLLVASGGSLLRCAPNDNGTYAVAEVLVDAIKNSISDGARFFVVDADNSQGKDVYIGQAGGEVQFMRSAGKDFLASVTGALLDKMAQVSDYATESGLDLTAELAGASVAIEADDFNAAARAVKQIVAVSSIDSDLYAAAVELVALLNQ